MGLGRVKSCMSLYVCSNYCKHCSSNAPAGRQAEKRKPHQFRLRLAVFLPRYTRGPWPSTHWQTRAPATRDGQCGWGLNKAARPEFRAQVGEGQYDPGQSEPSRCGNTAAIRALESIERLPLKSVLITSEMLALAQSHWSWPLHWRKPRIMS